MEKYLTKQEKSAFSKTGTDTIEFDEALVKKLIEKIAIFADHYTVEFTSGITNDIKA